MNSKKWLVVGISGATCSGKTTLVNRLHKELRNSIVLHGDDYFLAEDDPRHVMVPELNHCNWELATSLDVEQMRLDVLAILESSPTKSNLRETDSTAILIMDGFNLFKCKDIADLCDIKYFLTLTKEECWGRRKERTYNPSDVPGYFEKIVWPEYMKHETELMKDKILCKTVTFIDGSKERDETFHTVLTEIKKWLS